MRRRGCSCAATPATGCDSWAKCPPRSTPAPDATDKKHEEPKKPKEPAKPARDPAPTAAIIDAEVDRHLATAKIPASPQADDAEFLRRVYLDLTGRIPTHQQTVDFLDSKDPGALFGYTGRVAGDLVGLHARGGQEDDNDDERDRTYAPHKHVHKLLAGLHAI